MHRRRSNTIRILLLTCLILVFLLMGVLPLIESRLPLDSNIGESLEWLRSRVMETMVALWFFAFGSMVGSFVNVVVWRMPRGVSVVSKGSACPWCTAKIKLKDNIPIFGWIKLGGRCRVCRLPISPRYPIVEAIFGSVFLLMFFVELQSAGGNLPGGSNHLSTGILQVIVSTKWDVIASYSYHMTLIVMLLIWSLMALDGSRLPVKTIVFALLIGFAGTAICPWVLPVKWVAGHAEWFADLPWIQRVDSGFLGLTCGFFVGESAAHLYDRDPRYARASQGAATGMMTIGLFLGWQAVTVIVLLLGVFLMVRSRWERLFLIPLLGILTAATVIHLCMWYWIDKVTVTGGAAMQAAISGGCLVVGLLLIRVSRSVAPPLESEPRPSGSG